MAAEKLPGNLRAEVGLAPEPSTNGSKAAPEFPLTDTGNAERLVARHGKDIRYVHAWGRWKVWTGKCWRIDDTGEIGRRGKGTVRSMYGEAEAITDSSARRELASHAMKCESESRLRAMIALAQSEEGIPVRVDAMDADPWLLNVANGTIDLRTGELQDHRRENLITKLAPVEYHLGAQAEAWEAFLERILPDKEVRRFLQRAVGYSLTGDTRERVLFILHGMGRNGKSTFLEAIREALGSEDGYAMKMPAETLMAKPTGGIPNDIARLKGARFVSASETEKDRRLAEALVKEITGNDTISARFMRGEWFDFRPTHKVWLGTNHKPEIRGTDPAIWDRIRLVPFDVRILDEEVDKELPEKLRAELPGILAWAVRGCLDWQRDGLGEPDEVKAATAEYRSEMDTLATFIRERCVVHPNAWCNFAALYEVYEAWCVKSGEKSENRRGFGARLKERGFLPDNGTGNVAIRRGIGLGDRKPDGPGTPSGDEAPGPPGVNEEPSVEAPSGASEGASGQGVNEPASKINSRIPCKYQESGKGVNESYPTSGLTSRNSLVRGEPESRLINVNSLIPEQNSPGSTSRRLTADEVQEVQRLRADGWSAAAARAEVLGEERL